MRLLALDASSVAVGWAVFHDGEYIASGVYVPGGHDWHERVDAIWRWADDTVQVFGYDAMAYEIASGDRGNMHTNRVLGAVEFACWLAADRFDLRWLPVNVRQVKATGCHKGALKVAEAEAGRPLDARNAEDEADAIGVGLAAVAILKREGWEAQP